MANITAWGKVRRTDSEEGDTMNASSLVKAQEDSRDATFVRVSHYCCFCSRRHFLQCNTLVRAPG